VAFALGTDTWMIGSQGLWQHGLAELLIVVALLLLTGTCTAGRALAVGVLFGLITANRPPDAFLVAAMGLYGLRWAKRRAWLLFAGGAVPVGLVLAYNLWAAGAVFGGYGLLNAGKFLRHDMLASLAGLLFSPARGLFIFSPFLILLLASSRRIFRDRRCWDLTVLLAADVVLLLFLYSKFAWRGVSSLGALFLSDYCPVIVWVPVA